MSGRRDGRRRSRQGKGMRLAVAAAVVALALGGAGAMLHAGDASSSRVEFTDVEKQTLEFIGYYDTIELTAEQERVKKEALTAIPAPCCHDNTAYTCCCPCNMAKSWWGLTHYLIVEKGYDAEQVRETVERWFEFINPDGFSGDSCYTGGCPRPFHENGCGGMSARQIAF